MLFRYHNGISDFANKLAKKVPKKIGPRSKTMAKDVRKLASPTTSLLRKRKLLSNQQVGGGIFTIIASTIIPALLSAIVK